MPLVLVKISKDQKTIYHLDRVVSLEVSVETLKSRPTIGQCHRCQKFGHAQSRCTATRRCVACAGDHEPGACERPKQVPATCANCGEEHPANYRGCARYPKSALRTIRPTDSPADATRARSRPSPGLSQVHPDRGSASSGMADGGRSYSRAVTGPPRSLTQGNPHRSPKVRTGIRTACFQGVGKCWSLIAALNRTGIRTACFQGVGKCWSLIAALNRYVIWTIALRGRFFSNIFCIPSGPGALREGDSLMSLLISAGDVRKS
ncbi:hypothetical protein QE152_g39529 [Popillia japonica]|uniref:Nucleic-acid-binding protein from transposon X-element n=1 Tax=Popillia japonica TaxID=7064 RepID=A0AAW1HTN6_POPJA